MGGSTTLISPQGKAVDVDIADVGQYLEAGYTRESTEGRIARDTAAVREAETPASASVALGALSGFTLGGSDALFRAIGGEEGARQVRNVAEAHPTANLLGNVAGGLGGAALGIGPAGFAAKAGASITALGEGAGTIARIGAAAAGGTAEGALYGLGGGVSELALGEEPVDVERAVSVLSSSALYGAAIGAGAGTVGKSLELGLVKGRAALGEVAAENTAKASVAPDLATLDRPALDVLEKAEVEGREAARVGQRAELADDIHAFRREGLDAKQLLATKDVKLPAREGMPSAKELGKLAAKAGRQLDGVLDNPVGLAQNPGKALDALQRQENAYAKILERETDLRAAYAAERAGKAGEEAAAGGSRDAALDTIAKSLERNRALQARIGEITSKAPTPRMLEIQAAKGALETAAKRPETLTEKIAKGAVYSAAAGAVYETDLPGASIVAPLLGAHAAGVIGSKVFGRMGAAMQEAAARQSRAIDALFAAGTRAAKAAPPLATRVLARAAFAPAKGDTEPPTSSPSKDKLATTFAKRSAEIRDQVETGPGGAPMMRQTARARVAAALQPIAVHQPVLADRMETLAAKRVTFLASKLPRRPELGAMQLGPDHWQPSDMEMRQWARFVAASEDPDGVIERVAHGTVTPEDAETMRTLYPEQLADLTRRVLERLPTLRASLPYHRRLALSVLTGVPVDPSLDPRILAVLQSQYQAEPEKPKAQPQFGSVRAGDSDPGTLSERRERGTS